MTSNIYKELEVAHENGLYILSLNTALIIPDVCGALESENGKARFLPHARGLQRINGIPIIF